MTKQVPSNGSRNRKRVGPKPEMAGLHPIKETRVRRDGPKWVHFFRGRREGRFLKRFKTFLELTLCVDKGGQLTDYWITLWEDWSSNEGPITACKRMKQVYDIGLRLTAGQSITPIPYLKANKDGIPTLLSPFLPLLTGNLNARRTALHILSLWRLMKIESPYSLTSISEQGILPPPSPETDIEVGSYFGAIAQKLGSNVDGIDLHRFSQCWVQALEQSFPSENRTSRISKMVELSDFHLSSKNGPNGPALATAVVDRQALRKDKKLEDSILKLLEITKNPSLPLYKTAAQAEIRPQQPGRTPLHSRLSVKTEPGGKARIFAICDYWSQCALTGIHSWNYQWLSNQPEDGTKSHNYVSEIAKGWTLREPEHFYEVYTKDLSSATDRLPRWIQREICQQQFGSEVAAHWSAIVGERTFTGPGGEEVRYAVGQPMGLLSSWSYLAIWHHMIHRAILIYLGIDRRPNDPRYLVIGDDEANLGPSHSAVYKTVLEKILGISISEAKSFKGKAPNQNRRLPESDDSLARFVRSRKESFDSSGLLTMHSCEIAKRVFVNGHELTPVPPKAVQDGVENAEAFPSLLKSLWDRGELVSLNTRPLPALANLGYKPRLAMQLATFPPSCTPQLRVMQAKWEALHSQGRTVGPDQDFGENIPEAMEWYRHSPATIELAYTTELRKRMVTATKRAQALAKEYLSYSKDKSGALLEVSHWIVERATLSSLLHKVANATIQRSTKSGLMGLLLKANLTSSVLREEIGKSHDLLNLELILKGRAIFRDEKDQTRKVLAQIQRDVLKRLTAI